MRKFVPWFLKVLSLGALTTLCGCAVVSSYRTNMQAPQGSGVSYYLPKRDVIVSLTIPESKADAKVPVTFAIAGTSTYPDISNRFVAKYRQTLIGTDKLNIGVTPEGLLTSTTADFKSRLPAILVNVAEAVALLKDAGSPPPPDECRCKAPGSYSERFPINSSSESKTAVCGYSVTIERLGKPTLENGGVDTLDVCPCTKGTASCEKHCKGYGGLFFRQQEPYTVMIDGSRCGLPNQAAIVFSPNMAPLEFVKVERGLFADANTTFKFKEGSLESYEQNKSSEIEALSALPADIATAYFTAIGTMFQLRTTAVNNEAGFEKALAALELQQQRTKACLAAIASKDSAGIDANCK